MPDTANAEDHVKPFVYETLTTKALHFSISEIQSRMQVHKPLALDLDYTRTMMGFLLFNDRPDTIGMVGLGGGSLAKFCRNFLLRIPVVVNTQVRAESTKSSQHEHGQPAGERSGESALQRWTKPLAR